MPKPTSKFRRYGSEDHVALGGRDVITYFDKNPQQGSPDFEFEWNDMTWHFTSEHNRQKFSDNPERFAPRFEGNCVFALRRGDFLAGSPTAWKVVDGLLYLSFNRFVNTVMGPNSTRIGKAAAHWQDGGQR